MPLIVNLQRKIDLKSYDFRAFAARLASSIDETGGAEFSVAFVSDRRMKELNKLFRGKDATTDVLSFLAEQDEFEKQAAAESGVAGELGDIVISVEQASKQAVENGLSLEAEIKQLILHGVLHLCAYDHETDDGEMNKRELELRDRLGI